MPSKLAVYDLRTNLRAFPKEVDGSDPVFSWRLRSSARGDDQAAYRLVVRRLEPSGQPVDAVWDTGWVTSNRVRVRYEGGSLDSFTSYSWQVHVRWKRGGHSFAQASFETGALSPADWCSAWIGRSRERITGMFPAGVRFDRPRAMQMAEAALRVRRDFDLTQPVLRARLFTTAHGVYRAFINGQRVGDDELPPGWTDYRERVQYQAHDVTDLLLPGGNAIGMVVGDGWWAGCVGYDVRRHANHYGTRPHAFAQLVLDFEDGSRAILGTDDSWRERPGEIVYSDLLMGEAHDLTLADDGWCLANGDLTGWTAAVVYDTATHALIGQRDEPAGVIARLTGTIIDASPSRVLIDFGQNMVGHVALTIEGTEPGRAVQIRHGEVLDQGKLSTENLRSAEATDTVVPRAGLTRFEPWFTFHGFRYAEVSGLPAGARITDVEGIVVSSRLPEAGRLDTSSALVEQLVSNIRWSLRGNFLSIPTDCPQRDERLGWTADAQVFAPTASYLSDVEAFFDRWLLDLRDDQLPNGSVPDVIPLPPPAEIFDFGAPGWGDAATIIPWHLYRTYGNRQLLQRQYPSMKAWVDYVTSRTSGGLWDAGLGNNYGDWLSVDEDTPRILVATAYRARSADLVALAAETLGLQDDASRYSALASAVRKAFADAFVSGDRLRPETQTGYVFALAWDLVSSELRATFGARLAELVRARGVRLATGFLGVGLLCPTLTEIGESELAFDLLFQTEYPSWGYSILHGATTIWERWDAWTEHAGFQSASMNSFNHYSLGSVGEWLFRSVGGIGQAHDAVGFESLVLHPHFDPRLNFVRGAYESPRGLVRMAWERDGGTIRVETEVPPGAEAVALFLPGAPTIQSGRHEYVLTMPANEPGSRQSFVVNASSADEEVRTAVAL